MSPRTAFTLAELMVVVGVLTILSAIAVPNLLEAQVRSKVSRARADLVAMRTAVEAYAVDYRAYLRHTNPRPPFEDRHEVYGVLSDTLWYRITTPIAYMTRFDRPAIFPTTIGEPHPYTYVNPDTRALEEELGTVGNGGLLSSSDLRERHGAYALESIGPMGGQGLYDPTNGAISLGVIQLSQRRGFE